MKWGFPILIAKHHLWQDPFVDKCRRDTQGRGNKSTWEFKIRTWTMNCDCKTGGSTHRDVSTFVSMHHPTKKREKDWKGWKGLKRIETDWICPKPSKNTNDGKRTFGGFTVSLKGIPSLDPYLVSSLETLVSIGIIRASQPRCRLPQNAVCKRATCGTSPTEFRWQ